jgi:regulator of sigma E protease
LGIELAGGKIGAKWYAAPAVALVQEGNLIKMTVAAFGNFVKNLFVKREVSKDVTGMVGVGIATDFVRKLGVTYVLQFIALISLSLGVMNLLPVVPLDGGHLLVTGIEAARRKKLNDQQMQWMMMGGLAFILLLVGVTTYSDILRFSVWDRIVGLFK